MGKVTGFLEIDRQDRKYAPASDRIRHYKEFVLPVSDATIKDQASRCMNCGIPFCHNGCPVNNQIPDWNDLVYQEDWEEALRNLHSTNNFPEFTGRVCPAPCEAACTLNIEDTPVTIKSIECAIIDKGWEMGWVAPEPPKAKTGKSIGIVGSGPPASPPPSSSPAPAMTCISTRSIPAPAACCATASPTSRWRSATSTAASSRWRRRA